MDLEAVRTFVAVADAGQFSEAADNLSITQQAVSKRVAALEKDLDEPVQLLVGPAHEFAAAPTVTPAELAGHWIWMPGIVTGTEWAAYYDELAAAFGLTIDAAGPNFGTEPLLDVIAGSPELATFVGELTWILWPADYDLRRIAVHDPTPVYPHSLIWRGDNPHPALATLRAYLGSAKPSPRRVGTWTPKWAQPR